MRSFGATAIVAFAVITECFGAHSDRSRHRSGPIRSVPVGADIKRDTDFDCPEEFGYYPHPSDCTLYYVCVFGGALLESCTGGLMYSHELQTCDWPRNVGCDAGTVVAAGEELERISEREPPPPPPPPRRTPQPPPPRAQPQPNPIITSRGQPKFNRDEYEKQQQLYAEVDDLPPVEEIESDRQQRVYRGQPSTIGQVQKDRDGYTQVNSGRNFNSNIIPASISQNNGKIGSFSFGTQVDERRAATITQAPQTYSEYKRDNMTDSIHDRQLDIKTNEIFLDVIEKPILRKKRDLVGHEPEGSVNSTNGDSISKKSDKSRNNDEEMEYFEYDTESVPSFGDERGQEDSERGKRQIRYFIKNGYKNAGKNWGVPKATKLVDSGQFNYNQNLQNTRHQQNFSPKHYPSHANYGSSADSYQIYQIENSQSQRPFKASLHDPARQNIGHNSGNVATQIITKSPPISALKNNENPFSSLAGGFYNNAPQQNINQNNNHFLSQFTYVADQPKHQIVFPDSSQVPSTIMTGKPILASTTQRTRDNYNGNPHNNGQTQNSNRPGLNLKAHSQHVDNEPQPDDYDDDENESGEEDESSENSSSEKKVDDNFKHSFPEPPYEFTHPTNRFKDIENPFANPNFDFDAFLAKLSGGQYAVINTERSKTNVKNGALRTPVELTTASNYNTGFQSSTLNYKGMSTPRPFVGPIENGITYRPIDTQHLTSSTKQTFTIEQWSPRPTLRQQNAEEQQTSLNQNTYKVSQQNAGVPLEAQRPKLKPPNFKDERQLPINYSFNRPTEGTNKQTHDSSKVKSHNHQVFSVTQKPYILLTGTGSPVILSTPKQQFLLKQENILAALQSHVTGKPYLVSSGKPNNAYVSYKSTPKPLTTIANEQLQALQHYWKNNPSSESYFSISTSRPNVVSELPRLENMFLQTSRPSANSGKIQNILIARNPGTSPTKTSAKRRPIPKPSPEMSDYYYDEDEEDEQYYYEPPVKSKYMPSSEVRPQRPPMAQNYKEYDDSYEEMDGKHLINISPSPNQLSRVPAKYPHRPETVTKNYNDVSVVTKSPNKNFVKNMNGKIPVPVLINFATPTPTVLMRPEISNYEIIHHNPRNRTVHIRKPIHSESGPYTLKPPKHLNQTTLRPYTVRHRLAKPTTVSDTTSANDYNKQTRGRIRHQNIVAQMKHTTPRDNQNQETRYTKTKHDDKTNSLQPTEDVAPASYSASPRPKMLYNGTQNYSPDQYDPFYAVYDEDGELYKDTDYVQQYNTASLRPAVQQTYRGTPPPAQPSRRPVDVYTPRPVVSADDYDDALIQGQAKHLERHLTSITSGQVVKCNFKISNQNQYQSPVRHSTRGDGNELGYDHNPSSVKTTLYEATSISTTPSTTTRTSTTQRSTTAHFTEAMTPPRYTSRSPTDESPIKSPEPNLPETPADGSNMSILSTPAPTINLSSLAKPFERTDNLNRLSETILSTEKTPTSRLSPRVTNYSKESVDVVQPPYNQNSKKVVSLTSGFSIRRNPNNTKNPYTLTVLTRPIDEYSKSRRRIKVTENIKDRETQANRYYYQSDNNKEPLDVDDYQSSSEANTPQKDVGAEITNEDDIPIYVRPTVLVTSRPKLSSTVPTTSSTSSTKYYIKTVVRRPAPFSSNNGKNSDSTENSINTNALVETPLEDTQTNRLPSFDRVSSVSTEDDKWQENDRADGTWDEAIVSPYRSLNNLRNNHNSLVKTISEPSSSTISTTHLTSSQPRNFRTEIPRSKPYYTYGVVDEIIPDHTTEIFGSTVKNVIKAFFNNLVSTPKPKLLNQFYVSTPRTTPQPEEKTVNIGFQKKVLKFVDEKPLRNNVNRLQIITEPSIDQIVPTYGEEFSLTEREFKDFSSTSTTTPSSSSSDPIIVTEASTTPTMLESSTKNEFRHIPNRRYYETDFNSFVGSKPETQHSRKFQKLIEEPTTEAQRESISVTDTDEFSSKLLNKVTRTPPEIDWDKSTNKLVSEIASTTSTTKATMTTRVEPTFTTKSLSFPTRASRVNPAIKLAATNPGGGRRSYQTSSKCSSDNSLQANPKCNEIKYQRPSSTRGRGSAHYSVASDGPQPIPNRGTPPTRSRPTLKPSTAIVSKSSSEFVDVYAHPPTRPAPVYPQPTPDKTAAKCRKDVCLLPDCSCGGKDIPGDLPVETVPQIVLLTFDDSVNDLNKGLYTDLFEKGRVNPNGCPITATFYVSHEWTDYSQVQNLYSAGHEMASHTVSHSFGEQFSQKKWNREVGGQREILAAYGGVKLEDVRGMRAPFLSVGGNKMFKMLHDSNFTYDSSMPVYENRPPSWPYTLDYKLFHDCMIPPCPTKSYPGVWEVPMVMWQDLNGGRCSMGDACANPSEAENVYKMILKNFDRHYTTNRAPFGLFYHAAWFTQPHHKAGFIMFLDFINQMQDVWIVTNWQALQWVRDPTPISRINNFQPFQCNYQDRPKKCNNPKVCNLWHKSGVRYMRTCQPCPEIYPWTGKTGIKSSRIDNDVGE